MEQVGAGIGAEERAKRQKGRGRWQGRGSWKGRGNERGCERGMCSRTSRGSGGRNGRGSGRGTRWYKGTGNNNNDIPIKICLTGRTCY